MSGFGILISTSKSLHSSFLYHDSHGLIGYEYLMSTMECPYWFNGQITLYFERSPRGNYISAAKPNYIARLWPVSPISSSILVLTSHILSHNYYTMVSGWSERPNIEINRSTYDRRLISFGSGHIARSRLNYFQIL
jgi:hypothetical protein